MGYPMLRYLMLLFGVVGIAAGVHYLSLVSMLAGGMFLAVYTVLERD